ncbi:MAG: hypothetical protein HYY24_28095 [Verrucomicrobia bacterium]|nr:hypothetical protein [Verrucomicrobiota bacterium]
MNTPHKCPRIALGGPASLSKRCLATGLFLVLCGAAWDGMPLRAQTIVVPNQFADKNANTFNNTPVGEDFRGVRDMVIFDASQFAALSGPAYLTRFAYRPDASSSPRGPGSGTMKIFASTTKRSVATLSSTFALNLGADNTLVFEGTVSLTSSNLPATGNTRQFDIVFILTTPFLYDPAAGNLVLDLQIVESHGSSIGWDAVTGDPMVGNVYAIGSSTATAGQFGTVPVMQFTFEPAPVVTIRTSQVELCWASVSNATYRVEWQSDVTSNTWTPLVDCIRSTGPTTCIQDAVAQGAAFRFYRVVRTDGVPR